MFSGIVEELGEVIKVTKQVNLSTIELKARIVAKAIKKGDSICIDGVCLTVTQLKGNLLSFDIMKETLDKTTLGALKSGSPVNLERALRANDRISGHFVTGHIDGLGKLLKIIRKENYAEFHISVGKNLLAYVVPKGSICVNGVSLTVGKVGKNHFTFYLIPYTHQVTNLGKVKESDFVNIETDVLAKYVLNKTYA